MNYSRNSDYSEQKISFAMSALKVHTVFGAESICELKYSQWPDYHNKFKPIYILYNSQLRFDIIKKLFSFPYSYISITKC